MGTTLTGTTPQDTYDSLIKVTDNGPLSGTAKYLSDGLGNDSALAMSTARVGVGTNTPAEKLDVNGAIAVRAATASFASASAVGMIDQPTSGITRLLSFGPNVSTLGSFQFYTTGANNTGGVSPMTITNTGNVGIGTSTPANLLDIQSTSATLRIRNTTAAPNAGTISKIVFEGNNDFSGNSQAFINSIQAGNSGVTQLAFGTSGTGDATATERFRITNNGVTFNGDTAAANALDDYEEGTWTMTLAFGGGSTGITYANRTGTYTKIGRQVTVNGYLQLTNKGSSTGTAQIIGLPFANGGATGNYSPVSLWLGQITFATQIFAYIPISTTGLEFFEINGVTGVRTTINDADFSNTTDVIISATYFV